MYRRLTFAAGVHFDQGQPFPSKEPSADDPKIWLILFQPGFEVASMEGDNEDRYTTPAKYLIYMCKADGSMPDEVQVHEVWAEKVHMASRFASQDEAIEEIEDVLRSDIGEDADSEDFKTPGSLLAAVLKKASKSNGQASASTAAAAP